MFYCGLLSVKLHPFIQFEWPPWEFELSWNSCTLHDHCIVPSLFYWLYRATTFHCSTIMPFSCLIILNLLWDCVLVPRLLWHINMVSELTEGWISFSQKHGFLRILHEKLSKSSKFQHCTKAKTYHLIPQFKELLIKLAWSIMLGVMKT